MNRFALNLLAVCLATQSCLASDDPATKNTGDAQKLAAIQLTDIQGNRHSPFSNSETKAVALIFVSTDCPIANSFQPTLQKLHQQFDGHKVKCFLVYCSPGLTSQRIEQHIVDYQIHMTAILDSQQQVGRLTNAKVTPEAIVIDQAGQIRYRGLIDNLYVGYGKKRPAATQHYLREALDSLVSGTPIATAETKPIGCFIHYENVSQGLLK